MTEATGKVRAKTGFSHVGHCGAVFDPRRRLAVENSFLVGSGRDVFLTQLDLGKNEVKKGLVPFDVSKKPVFDGAKYVYFQEHHGKRFGRMDLDTLTFERLESAPRSFEHDSVFAGGYVYAFDYEKKGMKYDVAGNKWKQTKLKFEGLANANHPTDPNKYITLCSDGNIREVCVLDRKITKYKAKLDGEEMHVVPEFLPIPGDDGSFFVAITSKKSWKVFSSAADSWEILTWDLTMGNTHAAFYDPGTKCAFYHINGKDKWTQKKL